MLNKNSTVAGHSRSFIVTSVVACAVLVAARMDIPIKAYADPNTYDWTKQGNVDPLGGTYTTVASSADGSSLIVGTTSGGNSDSEPSPLYVSDNYGATWQDVAENADNGVSESWQSVAVSDNGQTMVAVSNSGENLTTTDSVNGSIFISHDGGSTWANISPVGPNEWSYVAISGDGSKIVAVASDDNSNVYLSSNGGQSWTTSAVEQVDWWNSISISDNGGKVLVGGENSDTLSSEIDFSDDGGSTWQDVSPDGGNVSFTTRADMSSNGDEIAVATYGWNGSNEYDAVNISNDDGANWTNVTPDISNLDQWSAVGLSGNGTMLAVLNNSNNTMFVSPITSGNSTSWTEEDPDSAYGDTDTNNWASVAFNSDGSHIIAASSANAYTGYDSPLDVNTTSTYSLSNAVSGQPMEITTPSGTAITCHSSVAESSLPNQDSGYSYPLGLVDFCFGYAQQSNAVTLTFVTNLKPNQVVLRSYDASTNQYSTITGASITETSFDGQPALQVTYNLPDSSLPDTDADFGIVSDPVGLAVAVASPSAPDTGFGTANNNSLNVAVPASFIILAAGLAVARVRRKINL